MSTTVRWGVVGTGGIAHRAVGDLQLCENAEVVAVCSRDAASAASFAQQYDIPIASGDFDALCASDDVDGVYIGIPHGVHFDYAARALKAGKHVICEKPLTMTSAEAEELQRLSRENSAFILEGMWMKFTPAFHKLRELLAEGAIGERALVQAGAGYPVPVDGPRRFWVAELGGGALYDLGVYTIALAHSVLGDPDEVVVRGTARTDGVDLHEAYTLRYASGALAQLVNSITTFVPPAGWLGGSKGCIVLDEPLFAPRSFRLVTGTPPARPTTTEFTFEQEGAGYVPMFRAAGEAILAGRLETEVHPMSDTIAVLRIMERVRDALMAEGELVPAP